MLNRHRRAFALAELVVTVAIVAVVSSLLIVLSPRSRQMAWQAGSIANLHEFATVTASYAADNTDQFWSYSWRVGVPTPSQYPDLQYPPSDPFAAATDQAVDIIRRRGRSDMPWMQSWTPIPSLHYLPLADYLDTRLPMRFVVSPGDRYRLLWSNDIPGFDAGVYLPYQPDPSSGDRQHWPYTSSYRVPHAFFSPDAATSTTGTFVGALDWSHYNTAGTPFNLGGRRVSEVSFPSQKVHIFDNAQWQGVKQPVFFAYASARIPALLSDGSAGVKITSQANPGFRPDNPRSIFPTALQYSPSLWDPQVLFNNSAPYGMYFWTRGGIQGRDFEGPELDTSTWF
jgi:type II secretory pathway pseudopilin PulG